MYKNSQFSYISYNENRALLYNSYSNVIAKTTNVTKLRTILENPNEHSKDILFKLLNNDMFIVRNEINEDKLADMKLYDFIYENDKTLYITILPTGQCNFRCKYCYGNYKKGSMNVATANAVIKFLKKQLFGIRKLNIKWYGGEPLLAINIIEELSNELINICRKRSIIYEASIITNGYILSVSLFRKLLKLKIREIIITLDGDKNTHDYLRPHNNKLPTFNTILFNLREISEKVKTHTFSIIIRTNVNKDVLKHLEDYINLLSKEFYNDQRFMFDFHPIGDWGGSNINDETRNSFLSSMSEIYDLLTKNVGKLNIGVMGGILFNPACNAIKRHSIVIDPIGDLYKCECITDDSKNRIGSVNNKKNDMFNNYLLTKWVTPSLSRKKCLNCFYRANCYGITCPKNAFKHGFISNTTIKNLDKLLILLNKYQEITGVNFIKDYDNLSNITI